jgi:tRNA(Phe) wybutosine-synthesizing methylase Tyw3
VDGHLNGFREADEDMLDYLMRKRKVDDEVVDLVWKTWSADPYVSLSALTVRVNAVYEGDKSLNQPSKHATL